MNRLITPNSRSFRAASCFTPTAIVLIMLMIGLSSVAAQEEHPAAKYGYGFPNPGGGITYSWDVFRNAFYGVPVDSNTSWFTAPFDMILYNEAIRSKMANPAGDTVRGSGRCFGWSTSGAMMGKFGGYRGFCGPAVQYVGADPVTGNPVEPGLTRVIEITQCQQLTLACLQGIIDQTIGGHSQDASYVYNRLREAIERDGMTILGLTKTLDPLTGAAHAIIAYEIVDSTVSLKKVMVVDPNRTWGIDDPNHRGWYERGDNFVLLDLSSHKWRFRMAGGNFDWPIDGRDQYDSTEAAQIVAGTTDSATVAAAHPISVGHLIVYPLAIAGVPGRTPTSLGLGVTALLTNFWIYNETGTGGRIRQFHDREGKRLFVADGGPSIDWNSQTGIGKMAPWFPMMDRGENDTLPFQLWLHRGPMSKGSLDVETGSGEMVATVGGNNGYVRVHFHCPGIEGRIRFEGVGSPEPEVIVENLTADDQIDIELLVAAEPGTTNRIWRLEGLTLAAGNEGSIRLKVDRYGGASVSGTIENEGRLTYEQRSLKPEHELSARVAVVEKGKGLEISRDEWKELEPRVGE